MRLTSRQQISTLPSERMEAIAEWKKQEDDEEEAGGGCRQKEGSSITNYIVIDSISTDFDLAILGLKNAKVIGLALEGIRDGRLGELCWLQISLDEYTFLFDMVALKSEAFDEGLKDVLEDYRIVKVVHDCRAMSDYLYNCHDIRLSNVFDTQVADFILFRTRNVDLLPMRANNLTICLMMHLGLPSTLFSTRYLKAVKDESPGIWRCRPAPDAVLEAAVFRVCYLTKLRLRLIDLMLKRFTDGCDVYVGLMRDAGENQIARLETQTHLVPSEFEHLEFFAHSSRMRREELRRREVVLQPRTVSALPVQNGSCATFFNLGGSKLYDMAMHGVNIPPTRAALGVTTTSDNEDDLDDEIDSDDDLLIPDLDYQMIMQDVNDTLDDLCQKDVDENDPAVNDDPFLDDKYDFSSRNDTIDLNFTTQEVGGDLKMGRVRNDLSAKVVHDFTLEESKEMSQRFDCVAVGDNCQKAQNVVTSWRNGFDVTQTDVQVKMQGQGLEESHLERAVKSLKELARTALEKPVVHLEALDKSLKKIIRPSGKPVVSVGKPDGSMGKLVRSLEKPVVSFEKLDGTLEKVIMSSEEPVEISEKLDESLEKLSSSSGKPVVSMGKPDGSLGKLVGSLEKPVVSMERSVKSLKELAGSSLEKSSGCFEKPVRSLEKPVASFEKLDRTLEKVISSSEEPVEISEKLDESLEKLISSSGKPVVSVVKPDVSLGKLGGSLEKPVVSLERSVKSLKELVGSSLEKSSGCFDKPVRSLEKSIASFEKLDGTLEKVIMYSEEPVGILEKLDGAMENVVRSPGKAVGCLEKSIASLEKLVGSLEKRLGDLEPVACVNEMVATSKEPVGVMEKPVGFSEEPVVSLEKVAASAEKLTTSSGEPVVLVEEPSDTVAHSEERIFKEPENPVNTNALNLKTETNPQSDDTTVGGENFTGLRNLPNRERFHARCNPGRKAFVPRRHNFQRRRNFRGTGSEWVDNGKQSGDESPDSTDGGVTGTSNSGDVGEDGHKNYLNSAVDSCNTENAVDRDVNIGQNLADENPISEVEFDGDPIEHFVLGSCEPSSDIVARSSPEQGLVRCRLPDKISNDLSKRFLVQDGYRKTNVDVDVVKRVNLAACGRGKALAKAVELLQMRRA